MDEHVIEEVTLLLSELRLFLITLDHEEDIEVLYRSRAGLCRVASRVAGLMLMYHHCKED